MSNSTIFFLSTVAGIFFSSFFNASFKKIFHMPDIKALNYAVALISGLTFIGVSCNLIYMALHHLVYINPAGMIYPGLYLGLNFFESYEIIAKKELVQFSVEIFLVAFFIIKLPYAFRYAVQKAQN